VEKINQKKVALVVDDDSVTLTIVGSLLKENNYDVVEGSDGIDAISKFILEKPSLIVIDLDMPYMDGCRASRIIRNMRYGNVCHIILFTSETNCEVLENPICKSVNIIINKVDIDKLREYIVSYGN